ncbi:MAG TPA: glycosyltransferase [Planctomycetaceae bacterium]|jgi:glycosyltransferase involved in cell wall biosynthesis|nr:glycosyltransferase [Planctomycetaceae bacterium]
MARLDIVIPVYQEGENITHLLDSFVAEVHTPCRVLICYDRDDDSTLAAINAYPKRDALDIVFVKNQGRGPHGAVMTGLTQSAAPFALVYMADDDFNARRIDGMVEKAEQGYDIVVASRFAAGGCMVGAPWLKGFLVRGASFTLYHLARLPVRDPSNGLRLFSRRVIDEIAVESDSGFCYSIELLVKCHRLGWPIGEVPIEWYERTAGQSRFRVLKWLPKYLRWYFYAFATTWLGARSVTRKEPRTAAV